MSLPPSMFGGDDSRYDRDDFNGDIWPDAETYADARELIAEWASGSGFTVDEWMDSITDVRNLEYDDDGNLESFDFDFETDDGYSGSRHVH